MSLPPHATRRRYRIGCHCTPCRAAAATYAAQRRAASASAVPPPPRVPAAALVAHLQQLAALGCGLRGIAARAACSPATLSALRRGLLLDLGQDAAQRLLAVTPCPAPGARIPATKTHRFLDSLKREGYTRRELAWHCGHHSQQLQLARRTVRASTAAKIARLYARLAES